VNNLKRVDAQVRTGLEQVAIRQREIVETVNRHVLTLLEPAFNHAVGTQPPRSDSGLVEMQRIFAKLR
jgi:hypothetical protein